MVDTAEDKPRLYSGKLRQYTINKDNSLENLYLIKTKNFTGQRDENGIAVSKSIPGDCLIIPYKSVLNINLNYFADKNKQVDSNATLTFLWLIFIVFLIATNLSVFTSDTLGKTILVKIFYSIYSFFILGLLIILFEPKIVFDKNFIESYDPNLPDENDEIKARYKLELAKKQAKMHLLMLVLE